MKTPIVLASGSAIRAQLLRNAAVPHQTVPARIDEAALRAAALAEGAPAGDIAGLLAEAKALKVSARRSQALVIGSDQVLEFDGRLIRKPADPDDLITQLSDMSGRAHRLISAVVVAEAGRPVWRHLSEARLTMRQLSAGYVRDYVERNWPDLRHCVGGYQLEAEGIRLFSAIEGDYFTILGLPLLELLGYLTQRGVLAG